MSLSNLLSFTAGGHSFVKIKKLKAVYSFTQETHLRTTKRHLTYGITQCYLPPDTGEHALPTSQAGRYSIYLPRRDERLSRPWRLSWPYQFSLSPFPKCIVIMCLS